MQQGQRYGFDASPLTDPIDRHAVRAFRESLPVRFPDSNARRGTSQVFIGVALIAMGAVFALIGAGVLAVTIATDSMPMVGMIFAIVGVVFVVAGIGAVRARHDAPMYRLDRFAQANGMRFHPGYASPQLPGMLFDVGRKRASSGLVRGDTPRFVEFGNYRYTTGSGKNEKTHTWGYIAVRLDAPLPHIVLDAKGNNSLFGSNLPIGFRKDQRLSLEGDFDEHFSLYCPEGYEADALYLFTPDIMQRFMSSAAHLDVEIVDDWLFFYSGRGMSTVDPDQWAWQFSVAGAMLDKIARWGRWRDERIRAAQRPHVAGSVAPVAADHVEAPPLQDPPTLRPPKGVARAGQRLKQRRIGWVGGVFIAAVIVFQIVTRLLE
ncbi:phage holin family protein [Microbacterium karelineae]|uniref:phage holin family protein n=1 Tax=Microbacterium karelineae TaxID=2654283 RepID=UPI0012EAA870|nr:phage holin family protein [Microbacterium karelineae]